MIHQLLTGPGTAKKLPSLGKTALSTGKIVELEGGPLAKNYFPEWSPDSNSISYSATDYAERGYYSLIQTDSRQGENRRTWAISDCFATPVIWSPNGNKIAYLSGCKNNGKASEIWLVNLTNPVPIRIVQGGRITSVQWAPSSGTFS